MKCELGDRSGSCGCRRGNQFPNPVRKLGAFRNPVLYALAFQVESGRIGAWIVRAHHFHRAAIASPLLLNHHHTVIRLFARAKARQSNHQHRMHDPLPGSLRRDKDKQLLCRRVVVFAMGRGQATTTPRRCTTAKLVARAACSNGLPVRPPSPSSMECIPDEGC